LIQGYEERNRIPLAFKPLSSARKKNKQTDETSSTIGLESLHRKGIIYGLLRTKASRAGIGLLIIVFAFILLGHFSPYSPSNFSGQTNIAPNFAHVFGTDNFGRDLFSEIAWGALPTLSAALIGSFLAVTIGLFTGVFAGYFGKLEVILGGIADIILTFPALALLIVLGSTFFPPNALFIAAIIAIVLFPTANRAIRNQVRSVKSRAFVEAAKMSGLGDLKVVLTILIPEVIPIAVAYLIIDSSGAVLLTAALEFLGVTNADQVSWGSILDAAQKYAFIFGDWWEVVIPGLFIMLISVGFALIGFSVEEIANPRLRRS
jgi:peptide/nickel transport system permease protein